MKLLRTSLVETVQIVGYTVILQWVTSNATKTGSISDMFLHKHICS